VGHRETHLDQGSHGIFLDIGRANFPEGHAKSSALPGNKVRDACAIWSPGAGASSPGADCAFAVDEIQYGKGHKYLTLVYQIDLGLHRLL